MLGRVRRSRCEAGIDAGMVNLQCENDEGPGRSERDVELGLEYTCSRGFNAERLYRLFWPRSLRFKKGNM